MILVRSNSTYSRSKQEDLCNEGLLVTFSPRCIWIGSLKKRKLWDLYIVGTEYHHTAALRHFSVVC